jgi:hypothetical protein
LIGISPRVGGVHIGGFLQYLCDALLVLGTILQGVARSGDKFGHGIRVFSEVVALPPITVIIAVIVAMITIITAVVPTVTMIVVMVATVSIRVITATDGNHQASQHSADYEFSQV